MERQNVTRQWNMGKLRKREERVNRMDTSICFCFLTQEEMAHGNKDVLAQQHLVKLLKTGARMDVNAA